MVDLLLFPSSQPGVKDSQDTRLGEALESCFPCLEDGALLYWNGVAVPLSYKYDLSLIIHDVIALVRHLRTCSRGNLVICWPSNTFHATWHLEVVAGRLRITASWNSVSAQFGPLEDQLNGAPVVEVSQADFMKQWVALLRLARQALLDTGYVPGELEDDGPLLEELTHHRW